MIKVIHIVIDLLIAKDINSFSDFFFLLHVIRIFVSDTLHDKNL